MKDYDFSRLSFADLAAIEFTALRAASKYTYTESSGFIADVPDDQYDEALFFSALAEAVNAELEARIKQKFGYMPKKTNDTDIHTRYQEYMETRL